ncbi:MAG: hypothetical protein K2H52_15860 [Lachnospiraceae bacterium]|nr:hypothetical protein [Lachnospiraceae bacterium]
MYNNLEINGQGVDKGAAILRLAEYLGGAREEIISVDGGYLGKQGKYENKCIISGADRM